MTGGVWWKRLLVAGACSLLVLWAAFHGWFYLAGGEQQALRPVALPSGLWQPVEGEGEVAGSRLLLTRPDRMGWATMAAQLPDALPAASFAAVRFFVDERSGAMELEVGLAAPGSLAGFSATSVSVGEEGWVTLPLEEVFFRGSEIGYVLVRARGGMEPPVALERVVLMRASPSLSELQGMIWRSLFNLEDWTQRSINHQIPESSPLRLSPVLAVVCWVLVSFVLYALLVVRDLQWRTLVMPAGVLVLAGWLVLDVFWQTRLWANHGRAISTYWGKTPDEKRLAEVDGAVFALVQRLKDELDDPARRVVIFGSEAFTHFRARYFAVPQPVTSRAGVRTSWIRRASPGDVLMTLYLPDALQTESLYPAADESSLLDPPTLLLEDLVGRDGEWVEVDGREMVRMQEGERPWLLRRGWHGLEAGAWRLELDLGATGRDGWVRTDVLVRDADGGSSSLLTRRELYARGDGTRELSLPFVLEPNQEIQIRVRELNARGTYVTAVRLVPREIEEGMVLLSTDGEPPYYLARKLLESEAGVAYEMF